MAFTIGGGVNVSHWLSQSPAKGEERQHWFTKSDAERIAEMGLDHVRIPVDESHLWHEDGTPDTEAFDLLNDGLDWAEEAGIRSIVDLHIIRSHFFNDRDEPQLFAAETTMERFGSLWVSLSDSLSGRSNDLVAYELLNEPVARDDRRWNQVYPYALAAIREREPERTVILGSNRYNQCYTFGDLAVPNDDNLILTYHYYNPMFVTHYRTPWTEVGKYDGPIQYPGEPVPEWETEARTALARRGASRENRYMDHRVIRDDMMAAVSVARQQNLPVHCGEFGCFHKTPADVKERWYRDMASVFRDLGVSWSAWDYKGAFGMVDRSGEETGVHRWLLEGRHELV